MLVHSPSVDVSLLMGREDSCVHQPGWDAVEEALHEDFVEGG